MTNLTAIRDRSDTMIHPYKRITVLGGLKLANVFIRPTASDLN